MLWPLRIAFARLRPVGFGLALKTLVVGLLFGSFLLGDYLLFRKLFAAAASIESLTPFFALGLVENLLGMVFLTAIMVLFSSSLTVAIGAFFSDLDLDFYHSAPRGKVTIILARWVKTMVESSYLIVSFLVPVFLALAVQYRMPWTFVAGSAARLLMMIVASVTLAAALIVFLVRLFPVRRVHQVALMLAIVTLTAAVVGFRMSRPERLFRTIDTDDVVAVLKAIELPAAERYPSSWLARWMVGTIQKRPVGGETTKLALLAGATFAGFVLIARSHYFPAFVRARESMAPVAFGSAGMTTILDRWLRGASPPARAMIGKEVRIVSRDAAQWSQLFMMLALLFLYLYNIKMLPLEGDVRAILVAFLNVGMAGFVIAAISLRFAYPSISSEGRAFWLMQSAPISYRRFLWVKVGVYLAPLLGLSLFLTAFANLLLDAPAMVWGFTLAGSALISSTLVALAVGMGGWSPNFAAENPLQVGLSLGGFAYMALSMLYVGVMMILVARPTHRFLFRMIFGLDEGTIVQRFGPLTAAVGLSLALIALPVMIAERRLQRRSV